MKYEVDFAEGHKTGFFCDQRDNRKRFGTLVKGTRVLDLCSYTGGFSINAMLGGATEVTAVDLDEDVITQGRRNANLNQISPEQAEVGARRRLRLCAADAEERRAVRRRAVRPAEVRHDPRTRRCVRGHAEIFRPEPDRRQPREARRPVRHLLVLRPRVTGDL